LFKGRGIRFIGRLSYRETGKSFPAGRKTVRMPNDYSGTKIVRPLNGQQFIDDFNECAVIWVFLPWCQRYLSVQKSDVWFAARGCKIRYKMTIPGAFPTQIMVLY
jgi:hypothetical protein